MQNLVPYLFMQLLTTWIHVALNTTQDKTEKGAVLKGCFMTFLKQLASMEITSVVKFVADLESKLCKLCIVLR